MRNPYRHNSKRFLIAELALIGKTAIEIFRHLKVLVTDQVAPMIFRRNPDHSIGETARIPKPIGEQLIDLRNEIGRVRKDLGLTKTNEFDSPEIDNEDEDVPKPEIEDEDVPGIEDEDEDEKTEDEETKTPKAKGKTRMEDELKFFLRRVREIRAFCEERARLSASVDSISMRPVQAASKLIPAGIPAKALIAAMTLHWSDDTRADAGIESFDFIALSAQILRDRGLSDWTDSKGDSAHKLFGYALTLAENRIAIMLVGPFGTGKSHLAKQLADYFRNSGGMGENFRYAETPMTPGATRGDLLGRHTVGGFITAEFCELYSGGGIFNFEEIDASDPSMLIVLNNALASDRLYNSANGENYDKSPDFIALATANTFGLGANREFTGRERQDAATLDRWRMGRIFVELDESIEEKILHSSR